jgi:hypothetical protein
MGRPLNKKYFGNRNIGSGGYQVDESAGGSANAQNYADDRIGGESVASAAITVAGSYTTLRPAFTFTAPTLPGGVTATGTITSEVLSATISGGTGYGNAQTFDLTVTTAGGSAVLNVTSTALGAITTVNSITSRGSFEGISAVTGVSGGTGTGAVPVLTYRAKSVTITEKGSGYVTAPTVAGYTNQGGVTVNNIVLTVDTGAVGSATNQENAILMTARLPGGSATTVDIIRQVSTNRYKVTDGTRTGIVKLKSSVATAAGEGSIRLVDSNGGTYFATKITAHKATITRGTGSQAAFVTGTAVKWNMTAATADSLLIDNA